MDKITFEILDFISNNPHSVKEISDYCSIPLPTVYRKIKILCKNQMLIVSGEIKDGVRNKLFRSRVMKINA